MPGPHRLARSQLTTELRQRAPARASDLAQALGVSVPTLHRLLDEQGDTIVSAGKARRARYALRKPLRGIEADLPLYEVDRAGQAHPVSRLTPLQPQGSCLPLAGTGWPLPEESADGWWAGLPYMVYDMCPQGYMGRQLARAEHQALSVDPDPQRWSDDDMLHVLSRIGDDLSGNLILGDVACERWLQRKQQMPAPAPTRSIGSQYTQLAEVAIAAGVRGSSAGGDFPKFAALRIRPGAETPHVLVKFSGADGSAAVRRWADLLVCEHLALDCVGRLPGGVAATSRIVVHAGRTFLETERFDRHGVHGRSRLVSLAALDGALVGDGSGDWPRVSARLAAIGLISADNLARIDQLHWFGTLVANTDMHLGNLSFCAEGTLALAPAYDMLPMLYAPLAGGEVPSRRFAPPLPLPGQRANWLLAHGAAQTFWQRASEDTRISLAFRQICSANRDHVRDMAEQV